MMNDTNLVMDVIVLAGKYTSKGCVTSAVVRQKCKALRPVELLGIADEAVVIAGVDADFFAQNVYRLFLIASEVDEMVDAEIKRAVVKRYPAVSFLFAISDCARDRLMVVHRVYLGV